MPLVITHVQLHLPIKLKITRSLKLNGNTVPLVITHVQLRLPIKLKLTRSIKMNGNTVPLVVTHVQLHLPVKNVPKPQLNSIPSEIS